MSTVFSDSLAGLCTQTVGVRAMSSRNSYGEEQYTGSATSYAAYVQRYTRAGRATDREDTIIEWVAYIPSSTLTLDTHAEVEYPTGVIRPVVAVDYRFDEHGQQFVVVSIGRANSR